MKPKVGISHYEIWIKVHKINWFLVVRLQDYEYAKKMAKLYRVEGRKTIIMKVTKEKVPQR